MGDRSKGEKQGPADCRRPALADLYAPIRTGTDIAFLGGVINYLIAGNKVHMDYIKSYTDMSYLVKDEFAFADGFFSGYDAEKRKYDKAGWEYQTGEDGYVKTDPTLENPRCVWNLLKAHFGLRMQKATQALSNHSTLRKTRRDIARAKTILNEKKKGAAQ